MKALPKNIMFDYKAFNRLVLDTYASNGRPRYTDAQKQDVLKSINDMMDDIHKLDYFSIQRNVKKSKWRPFIKNFLAFKNEDEKSLYMSIASSKVLIVDDIHTSGSTKNEILRVIRTVNNTHDITVFTPIIQK